MTDERVGKIDLDRVVEVETLGHRFRAVDPAQYPYGDYEFRDELDTKERAWLGLKEGDVVLDVGASWGGWTLLALAQGARVVAVEPSDIALPVLRRNVRENRWEDRCLIVDEVLGDGGKLGSWYREQMRAHFAMRPECRSRTLDDLWASIDHMVNAFGGRLDRVKVDIEGAEVELLAGGAETLRRYGPRLAIEDHTNPKHPGMENVNALCVALLREYGYGSVETVQPRTGNPFIHAVP